MERNNVERLLFVSYAKRRVYVNYLTYTRRVLMSKTRDYCTKYSHP